MKKATQIRVSQIRASQIRASQIRASQIRATEISSNHRELHGAMFFIGWWAPGFHSCVSRSRCALFALQFMYCTPVLKLCCFAVPRPALGKCWFWVSASAPGTRNQGQKCHTHKRNGESDKCREPLQHLTVSTSHVHGHRQWPRVHKVLSSCTFLCLVLTFLALFFLGRPRKLGARMRLRICNQPKDKLLSLVSPSEDITAIVNTDYGLLLRIFFSMEPGLQRDLQSSLENKEGIYEHIFFYWQLKTWKAQVECDTKTCVLVVWCTASAHYRIKQSTHYPHFSKQIKENKVQIESLIESQLHFEKSPPIDATCSSLKTNWVEEKDLTGRLGGEMDWCPQSTEKSMQIEKPEKDKSGCKPWKFSLFLCVCWCTRANDLATVFFSTCTEQDFFLRAATAHENLWATGSFCDPGVSGPDPDRNISPTSLSGPKKFSGPGSNLPGSPGWSEPGPEILGPHNDLGVWSLSGPGRCLVLLQREQE